MIDGEENDKVKQLGLFSGFRGIVPAALAAVILVCGCSVKPQPYSEGQMLTLALTDQRALMEGIPPLAADGRLSLEEAILRALVFNLDHRLALSENVSAERDRVLAAVAMLPELTANGNFYDRDNISASSSMSYRTRKQSLEPSFSSEPGRQWGNLEFSWSIVDCGLSYYMAKQQADRVLISYERRRRTMNTIVKDVVATYYRARAAQKYLGRIRGMIREADRALADYRQIEAEKVEPLPAVLENQRRLLNIKGQLERIENDLDQSRVQLAALCNFPLHEKFTLTTSTINLPDINQSLADLELLGLHRRPELREERYQERVDIASVKQEILRMFPAIRILGSLNFDANPYLVNSTWAEAGVQVSEGLVKMAVAGPKAVKAAEARQELSQMRRLALSLATLVQVNLSRQQYQISLNELKNARSLRDLERRLLAQVETEAVAEADGRLALVQQKAQTINSELGYDLARVGAYVALGNLYFSVGVGMGDDLPPDASIDALGSAVREGLTNWAEGRFPPLPAPEAVTDLEAPKVFPDNATPEERQAALERNVPR